MTARLWFIEVPAARSTMEHGQETFEGKNDGNTTDPDTHQWTFL